MLKRRVLLIMNIKQACNRRILCARSLLELPPIQKEKARSDWKNFANSKSGRYEINVCMQFFLNFSFNFFSNRMSYLRGAGPVFVGMTQQSPPQRCGSTSSWQFVLLFMLDENPDVNLVSK